MKHKPLDAFRLLFSLESIISHSNMTLFYDSTISFYQPVVRIKMWLAVTSNNMAQVFLKDGWASPHEGLFTAKPILCTCINLHICLIHSGLLSNRKKQKAKKKRGKSNSKRTFHLHHGLKSGHNLCCHKFIPLASPFVLPVSPFSMFTIAHMQQKLASFLFFCSAAVSISLLCLNNVPSSS